MEDWKARYKELRSKFADLMAAHDLVISCERVSARPDSNPAWDESAMHARCKLLRKDRGLFTFHYSAGRGHAVPGTLPEFRKLVNAGRTATVLSVFNLSQDVAHAWKNRHRPETLATEAIFAAARAGWRPDPVDVMQSLLSDCTQESFEDWCSEIGMDTDSRRAERMWNACRESDRVCRQAFGADFETACDLAREF